MTVVACSEESKMILGGHKSRSVRSRGLRIWVARAFKLNDVCLWK